MEITPFVQNFPFVHTECKRVFALLAFALHCAKVRAIRKERKKGPKVGNEDPEPQPEFFEKFDRPQQTRSRRWMTAGEDGREGRDCGWCEHLAKYS